MGHETITLSDCFEQGIRYEGLVESLGNAIARHDAAAIKFGKTTPEGKAQLESMAALAEVQRHLSPYNAELLLVVELMLTHARNEVGRLRDVETGS